MQIQQLADRVTLVGTLSVSTAGIVRAALHTAIDQAAGNFAIDLAQVTVRDSQGLATIVGARRLAERYGKTLTLLDPPLRVRHQLARIGMLQLFNVTTSDATLKEAAQDAVEDLKV